MQKKTDLKTIMEAKDVTDIIQLLEAENVDVWVDGGWAVDALLGKQTRPHEDVDIVIQQKDVPRIRKLLKAQGYKDVPRDDTSAWNFALGDDKRHLVDVHAIVFDAKGNGLYGPIKKGIMYPADSLTGNGTINGQKVRCISAEYLVKFHIGYKLDENDHKDVLALCERFRLKYPKKYAHPKK